MCNLIQNISIGQYRGINSFVINNLNNVNIVVGDNNSGKTTLLEALYLIRSPHSLNNALRSSKIRGISSVASVSLYEGFLNMFPKNNVEKHIHLQADGAFGNASLELSGEETKIIIDDTDLLNFPMALRHNLGKKMSGSETAAFLGTMKSAFNSDRRETPVKIISAFGNAFYSESRVENLKIEYLSPISHITENTFSDILKNDEYKSICVQLVRLFDPYIDDLVYMRNEITGRAVEYIKSKNYGLMPLETYGDGIKKVLSLANGIIKASGGALLIDEIDTSVHYKYYANIFNFLIKASAKFNVQLFITTHSKEAILEMLKTQYYKLETPPEKDVINVITVRKKGDGNVRSRSLRGFDVYTNNELFDFEVRI